MIVRCRSLALLMVALAVLCATEAAAQGKVVPESRAQVQFSVAPIVKRVAPAVVNVYGARNREALPQPVDGRVLPPLLRRQRPERALEPLADVARLGRDRRPFGPRHHQQPRHREHERGEGGARRSARIRGGDRAAQFPHGPRRAQAEERRQYRGHAARRFRGARSRRFRTCDRQSLRRRADRDAGHRVGPRENASRRLRLPVLHPDRRCHQPRQFGRRPRRHERQARRHQHGHLLAVRRQPRDRLCDPVLDGPRGH